jgi:ProP effector
MAGYSKMEKPVVILRKKRPAVATSASPQGKKGKVLPQTNAPVAKGVPQQSQPSPPPLPVAPVTPVPESTPPPPPGPTGRSAAQRRRYQERQRFLQSPEFTQIATAMTTRWPQLFRVTPETIRPLAIGIYHDLCAHLPDFPPKLIHHTLSQWMADHRVIYWKAVMQGGPRFDLEGNPKGEVTPEQQASAREQRKAWYDRRAQRLQQAEGTEPEAAPSGAQAGTE